MTIKDLEVISGLLLIPLFLVGLLFSIQFALATTIGGLLIITNLFFIDKGIERFLFCKKKKKIFFFIQHIFRFLVLLSIIYFFIFFKILNTTGFIVGLTIIFWGLLVYIIKNHFIPVKS
ncbi:MAG: hypothetical protein ACPLYC_01010, partial [Minisyncoccia bacterium]